MKGKPGDKQRLIHIAAAISEIETYTEKVTFAEFIENSMMRFASIKQLEIIGEAANLISENTRNKFTEIPWRQIIGLRHILVHEYFGVDSNVIWQIISSDLPDLKEKIQGALSSYDHN